MADKEGFYERWQREMAEAREQAAIRELERRIEKGEFPDNEDTVKAYCAGFYTAYTFQRDQKINREQPGESSRMGAMGLLIIGLMMVTFYGYAWYLGIKMAPQAPLMPLCGVAMLILSHLLSKRSKQQGKEADTAFAEKWGKKDAS